MRVIYIIKIFILVFKVVVYVVDIVIKSIVRFFDCIVGCCCKFKNFFFLSWVMKFVICIIVILSSVEGESSGCYRVLSNVIIYVNKFKKIFWWDFNMGKIFG